MHVLFCLWSLLKQVSCLFVTSARRYCDPSCSFVGWLVHSHPATSRTGRQVAGGRVNDQHRTGVVWAWRRLAPYQRFSIFCCLFRDQITSPETQKVLYLQGKKNYNKLTVLTQQLFYCMFYFACDRFLSRSVACLLRPRGDIAIRRVCLLVGSFVLLVRWFCLTIVYTNSSQYSSQEY